MGLPIPFSNIGTVVTDILPLPLTTLNNLTNETYISEEVLEVLRLEQTTVALALNAAQVWHYFTEYQNVGSILFSTQERLDLGILLQDGVKSLSNAIRYTPIDNESFERLSEAMSEFSNASYQFKAFLQKLTNIGRREWTEFNIYGMYCGIAILSFALAYQVIILAYYSVEWRLSKNTSLLFPVSNKIPEQTAAIILLLLHCALLTFSNSYIDAEKQILMFCIAIICLLLAYRLRYTSSSVSLNNTDSDNPGQIGLSIEWCPIIVVCLSRLHEELVLGHGIDPSLKLYGAQHPLAFILSALILIILRFRVLADSHSKSKHRWAGATLSFQCDSLSIICLCVSWWYKRRGAGSDEISFVFTRAALMLPMFGLFLERYVWVRYSNKSLKNCNSVFTVDDIQGAQTHVNVFRICLYLIVVTGASAISSVAIIALQVWSMYVLVSIGNNQKARIS